MWSRTQRRMQLVTVEATQKSDRAVWTCPDARRTVKLGKLSISACMDDMGVSLRNPLNDQRSFKCETLSRTESPLLNATLLPASCDTNGSGMVVAVARTSVGWSTNDCFVTDEKIAFATGYNRTVVDHVVAVHGHNVVDDAMTEARALFEERYDRYVASPGSESEPE